MKHTVSGIGQISNYEFISIYADYAKLLTNSNQKNDSYMKFCYKFMDDIVLSNNFSIKIITNNKAIPIKILKI